MQQELPTPDDDEALLSELRRVTNELDPIPEHVLTAAHAAIGWRTIDAELAELIADSAVDVPALLVRGSAQPRQIERGDAEENPLQGARGEKRQRQPDAEPEQHE